MNTKLLTSVADVKAKVPFINNEIDNTLIENTIILVQNTLVRDSLTVDMYEDIIINSGTTDNKYLIDNYISFIIAYGCWQQLAVFLSLQLNSGGLRIKVTDHSQAAESVDITFYRNYIQNFIDNTRNAMHEYISDNPGKYRYFYIYEDGKKPHTNNFKFGRVGGGNNNQDDCCNYWKTR